LRSVLECEDHMLRFIFAYIFTKLLPRLIKQFELLGLWYKNIQESWGN